LALRLWHESHTIVQFTSLQAQFWINNMVYLEAVKPTQESRRIGWFILLIWLVERSFGLIWTDLWGDQTDLHLKGVFISPFLSFDWSIWKYCGVVGLICNLREFLSVHLIHFDLSIWNYWQFLLVHFFGLIRTYSRLSYSRMWRFFIVGRIILRCRVFMSLNVDYCGAAKISSEQLL
jgi:hypothetical protein